MLSSARPKRKRSIVHTECSDCEDSLDGLQCDFHGGSIGNNVRNYTLSHRSVNETLENVPELAQVLPYDGQRIMDILSTQDFFAKNFPALAMSDDEMHSHWFDLLALFQHQRDEYRLILDRLISLAEFPPKLCSARVDDVKCGNISFLTKPYCIECTEKNLGLTIRKSSIGDAGAGLFTTRVINKNDFILRYSGDCYTMSQWNHYLKTEPPDITLHAQRYAFLNNFCDEKYIVAATSSNGGVGRYINDPTDAERDNCYSQDHASKKYIEIYAHRRIQAGEELFISYGDEYWSKDTSIVKSPLINESNQSNLNTVAAQDVVKRKLEFSKTTPTLQFTQSMPVVYPSPPQTSVKPLSTNNEFMQSWFILAETGDRIYWRKAPTLSLKNDCFAMPEVLLNESMMSMSDGSIAVFDTDGALVDIRPKKHDLNFKNADLVPVLKIPRLEKDSANSPESIASDMPQSQSQLFKCANNFNDHMENNQEVTDYQEKVKEVKIFKIAKVVDSPLFTIVGFEEFDE